MKLTRVTAVAMPTILLVGVMTFGASAKALPVTKMHFKLASHACAVGDTVTADVAVRTRDGHAWIGVAGAVVSLRVDGVEVGTFTADANGIAAISWVADTEGGHVLRVVYAGDDLHKRAQRSQGLQVTAAA